MPWGPRKKSKRDTEQLGQMKPQWQLDRAHVSFAQSAAQIQMASQIQSYLYPQAQIASRRDQLDGQVQLLRPRPDGGPTYILDGSGSNSFSLPLTKPEEEDTMPLDTRRSDITKTRIRDLKDDDRVEFLDEDKDFKGVVRTHPDSDAFWEIQWNDGGSWDSKKDNTSLLKNWKSGIRLADASLERVTKVDFDSVILADHKKQEILEAINQVDNHKLIFETWGFGETFEKGTAISLLFHGLPGTGKTLMGQAIADKFDYALKLISTAEIETPEPGGAERNIKQAFKEASDGNTVLLFDECDSLIHDRAGLGMIMGAQVNALLTALESHKGVVIFTTNRLGSLDPAFERRLSLKMEFSMPDAKHRIKIWQRMFPKQAPVSDNIRWEDLAKVEIAGGHIKNVVLKAARKAAMSKKQIITDDILWDCLESEVASSQTFTDAHSAHRSPYGKAVSTGHSRQRGMTQIARGAK